MNLFTALVTDPSTEQRLPNEDKMESSELCHSPGGDENNEMLCIHSEILGERTGDSSRVTR